MTLTSPTFLPLQQVFNFRDLGGHRTVDGRTMRTGRVWRADGLHRLHADDVAVLEPLGVRTVIDLRTHDEVSTWGHAPAEVLAADIHHLAVIQKIWDADDLAMTAEADVYLADRYLDMLDEGADAIAGALRLIADPARHGVVFHCAAGKDRTGVVAAITLGLLGVAPEIIAADYASSAEAMTRFETWIAEHHPDAADAMSRQPPAFIACPPQAMLRFLEQVEAGWGGFDALSASLGLERAERDAIREALLG